MKKLFLFLSFLVLNCGVLFAQEDITITTYYPSPYGSYEQLGTNKFAVDINGVAVASEFTAMRNGDAHIGRSLIIGAGGSGYAFDELVGPPDRRPADGTLLVKSNVGIGTTTPGVTVPSVKLEVTGDIYANDGWLRTGGSTGWYNQDFGGGWNMSDATWIRSYGGKQVYSDNLIRADGGFQVDGNQVIDANAGWHRSYGATGWYNQDFGGGWYMSDNAWIRSYGSKNIYHNTGIMRTDGTLQVGGSGGTLNVDNGGNLSYRSDVLFANTSGNVGIGTSSPQKTLEIVGSFNNVFSIHTPSNGADNGKIYTSYQSFAGDPFNWSAALNFEEWDDPFFLKFYSRGFDATNPGYISLWRKKVGFGVKNPAVRVDVAGSIQYTGSITDVSDIRTKENIKGINNALNKVVGLRGVYFNSKLDDDKGVHIGVIAQEVEKVLPEVVSIVNPEKGYKGVDYTQIVPVLIESTKELKAENDALKERVSKLEKKLKNGDVLKRDTLEL